MKKVFCLIVAMMMAFCCVGCVKMDVGIEVKSDGKATMTSKIAIEEDAYEMLLSFSEDADESTGDLDLKNFKKETIDDETYYSYEETQEFDSYEQLAAALSDTEATEGSKLFDKVEITTDGKKGYDFKIVTASLENDSDMESLGDDWLTVTMTVKMPGEVQETNGEIQKDGSVRFVMNDFSANSTYQIHSEESNLQSVGIIIMGVAAAVFIVGLVLTIRKKRS